jgi:hypothetical protein
MDEDDLDALLFGACATCPTEEGIRSWHSTLRAATLGKSALWRARPSRVQPPPACSRALPLYAIAGDATSTRFNDRGASSAAARPASPLHAGHGRPLGATSASMLSSATAAGRAPIAAATHVGTGSQLSSCGVSTNDARITSGNGGGLLRTAPTAPPRQATEPQRPPPASLQQQQQHGLVYLDTALPPAYRSVLPYERLNAVQSRVFDAVFNTDDSVAVAAPTGCGKVRRASVVQGVEGPPLDFALLTSCSHTSQRSRADPPTALSLLSLARCRRLSSSSR